MVPSARVFIACSLDGFIAGRDGDLSWLPGPSDGTSDRGFGDFLAGIGALLLGRNTYDAVMALGVAWPYGERPALVATSRPIEPTAHPVSAVSGRIELLVEAARAAAGDRDVYLDGGEIIRQALDVGLVDEVIVTLVPVLLGAGVPLFAGVNRRQALRLVSSCELDSGLVKLRYQVSAQADGT